MSLGILWFSAFDISISNFQTWQPYLQHIYIALFLKGASSALIPVRTDISRLIHSSILRTNPSSPKWVFSKSLSCPDLISACNWSQLYLTCLLAMYVNCVIITYCVIHWSLSTSNDLGWGRGLGTKIIGPFFRLWNLSTYCPVRWTNCRDHSHALSFQFVCGTENGSNHTGCLTENHIDRHWATIYRKIHLTLTVIPKVDTKLLISNRILLNFYIPLKF